MYSHKSSFRVEENSFEVYTDDAYDGCIPQLVNHAVANNTILPKNAAQMLLISHKQCR